LGIILVRGFQLNWRISLTVLTVLCAIVVVSGCTGSSNKYSNDNISFSYPNDWNVTDSSAVDVLLLEIGGTGIMVGEVFQDKEFTAEQYKNEVWEDWTWNQSTMNGNTVYQGFSNSAYGNTDSSLGYYKAIFIKNNETYYLQLHGTRSDIEDGYNQIVNSFKIK
jgi:hypothetical protein